VRGPQAAPRPAVNIAETDEAFELSLAVPGWQRDCFTLSVEQDQLKIAGQAPEATEETRYTRREFVQGDFERRFHLPETIDAEGIEATYAEGILRISLPKVDPKPSARSISVQ